MTDLSIFPNEARLWVFGADRALTIAEADAVDRDLEPFVTAWVAHGTNLRAAHVIRENRFVLIAVDETAHGASGCSIDAMVRRLAEVGDLLGLSLVDGSLVWYRDRAGDIVSCDRASFRIRSEQGEIDDSTPVFDLTIQTLGDLRSDLLERPARESWHARLLSSGVA
jgi:hypothetical protein